MKTLITFLGRVPKIEGKYRTTVYRFPDGSESQPVAFLGWELQRRLAADRLVILGTSGSMWDHLFEVDLDLAGSEDQRLRLMEAVERKRVEVSHLKPLQPLLQKTLGCEVKLELIPYAYTEAEQIELLRIMAKNLPQKETVHLDVTHGFRHLPMLALLAALYLQRVKGAQIEGIWYGSFDPDTKEATVLDLGGLLHLADWLQALATYDKSGDYGVFADLLGPSGQLLREAAFFERTTNPVKARQQLTAWREPSTGQDPAYDLFRDELHRQISWWKRPDRAAWEKELAWRYFERGDYLRAAIFGLESAVSKAVLDERGNPNDYDQRERARKALRETLDGFRTLHHLRNAFAHGVLPQDQKIRKAIAGENNLKATLGSLLKQILGPRES